MTPEEKQQLNNLQSEVNTLKQKVYKLEDLFYRINQIDKFTLDKPLIINKFKIPLNQLTTITDPTGGGTVDSQSRTAINSLIDRLQEIGLIS